MWSCGEPPHRWAGVLGQDKDHTTTAGWLYNVSLLQVATQEKTQTRCAPKSGTPRLIDNIANNQWISEVVLLADSTLSVSQKTSHFVIVYIFAKC